MKPHPLLLGLLALLSATTPTTAYGSDKKILLSKIKTLTLRSDALTTGRRLSPVKQLECIGGAGQGLYEVDVMRCTNMGSDYGDEDVSWECKADLPRWFKLGSTDVVCEGYRDSEDQYVLKGSCGVQYRLALTDEGYEKYGGSFKRKLKGMGTDKPGTFFTIAFNLIFATICIWIIYSAFTAARNPRAPSAPPPTGRPWFGGGGNDDDPPPPYDPRPPKSWMGQQQGARGGAWTPGFWSGAATGAAAGYMAGSRGSSRSNTTQERRRESYGNASGGGWSSGGESSSMGARHESTGFGQSRRR
ncbi:hypothetical protein FPQ18DRAFT_292474 [Pyronema domesticum]|uniref:Store-operated calcium entry-associated regulatory factor n=1 Tax=Pyronema omphalodes (strain CBS 100304) TaxID=1076935 RepID=U4LXT9_PYROM|nr:hypothetical protein FPQ18DRAFT_292474 [Pyronema domesticum]CCX34618.1 Similar to Store-operated calcium entry-associated regulatory factor; acc. no. Q8R3Q0 [Pyronema omphalodes CBS 100304]